MGPSYGSGRPEHRRTVNELLLCAPAFGRRALLDRRRSSEVPRGRPPRPRVKTRFFLRSAPLREVGRAF